MKTTHNFSVVVYVLPHRPGLQRVLGTVDCVLRTAVSLIILSIPVASTAISGGLWTLICILGPHYSTKCWTCTATACWTPWTASSAGLCLTLSPLHMLFVLPRISLFLLFTWQTTGLWAGHLYVPRFWQKPRLLCCSRDVVEYSCPVCVCVSLSPLSPLYPPFSLLDLFLGQGLSASLINPTHISHFLAVRELWFIYFLTWRMCVIAGKHSFLKTFV